MYLQYVCCQLSYLCCLLQTASIDLEVSGLNGVYGAKPSDFGVAGTAFRIDGDRLLGTMTFLPGDDQQNLTLSVVSDREPELQEGFQLRILGGVIVESGFPIGRDRSGEGPE